MAMDELAGLLRKALAARTKSNALRSDGQVEAARSYMDQYVKLLASVVNRFGLKGLCLVAPMLPEPGTPPQRVGKALRRLQRWGLWRPQASRQEVAEIVQAEMRRLRERVNGNRRAARDEDYVLK